MNAQIHAVQSYQKGVNDKYLESSDIQHTGPGRVHNVSFSLTINFEMTVLKQIWCKNITDQSDGSNPVFDQSNLRHTCAL